ncbi:MAG: extracellular solute-binding protein [Anaerolineae bacterium]|uniref:ABC transporter substrate-binding protein n=1 Tax=Candidatus Flexifilum breve TaxID=3140694 RepID=UPI001AC54CD2|nr:extracellular solute-binding protein [Chloroflexota bacterium]MBK9747685.1 extracellular solute-binding protein [Chloroflexota bacterium]MBN8636467.1 extracellular solute-binding protein [Anaerolineae bacterium]
MSTKYRFILLSVLLLAVIALPVVAQDSPTVTLISTQFNVVEEAEKFRGVLGGYADGTIEFVPSEEGPMLDLLRAEAQSGSGVNDVIGALHGTFPTLANEDLVFDLTDLLNDIETEYDISDAYVELGRMGTEDYQYYIPWMQATYTMAASNEALEYLPEGADVNTLTWAQLAEWAKNMYDATGEAKLGFPVAGLFHRFLQGYFFPSFTGAMVTQFNSPEAAAAFAFLRDELWPYVNPQSISYEFMQEPLLSGEVLVAFDHVARLKGAFDERPADFIAFPAPIGPAGRGFMPVVAGLAVPFTSANPEAAQAVIRYMLSPEVQSGILSELGFYPVISGVDMSGLSEGAAEQAAAVTAQATSPDSIVALLPIGLGSRGGELNQIFRDAFTRIVIDGGEIQTVLDEQAVILQTLLDETGAPCWAPDPASEGACQLASGM